MAKIQFISATEAKKAKNNNMYRVVTVKQANGMTQKTMKIVEWDNTADFEAIDAAQKNDFYCEGRIELVRTKPYTIQGTDKVVSTMSLLVKQGQTVEALLLQRKLLPETEQVTVNQDGAEKGLPVEGQA